MQAKDRQGLGDKSREAVAQGVLLKVRAGLATYNDKDSGNAGGLLSPSGDTRPATSASPSGTGSSAMPEIDRRSWDMVTSKVEDLQYQQTLLTNRMSRLDDFSARLGVVEYSTEQSKAYVHEATEEFKLKLEGFKERLHQAELEAESSRRAAQLVQQGLNQQAEGNTEFRQMYARDSVEVKADLARKLEAHARRVSEHDQVLLLLEPQIQQLQANAAAVEKRSVLCELKAKKCEQGLANVEFNYQKKDGLAKFSREVKAALGSYDARIIGVQTDLLSTNLYLERYLQPRMLNLLKDVLEPSVSNYGDRKELLTKLDELFKAAKEKIALALRADAAAGADRNPLRRKCLLNRVMYSIPEIEIPETLSYGDEEEEEELEEVEERNVISESEGAEDRDLFTRGSGSSRHLSSTRQQEVLSSDPSERAGAQEAGQQSPRGTENGKGKGVELATVVKDAVDAQAAKIAEPAPKAPQPNAGRNSRATPKPTQISSKPDQNPNNQQAAEAVDSKTATSGQQQQNDNGARQSNASPALKQEDPKPAPNDALIDALVKNRPKAHTRSKDAVDHQLVETDVEGYVKKMAAETGEKVITPDLMPREALHYISEGSEEADASLGGDKTPAVDGKSKKQKRQGAAGKASGGKVSKKASLRRKQADHSPDPEPEDGVQSAVNESSSPSRRPHEALAQRGKTMAHPVGATSQLAHTKTTDPPARAPAQRNGESKPNRSKSTRDGLGTPASLNSSNTLARTAVEKFKGLGRADMHATGPRGGGGMGRLSKAHQALLDRLGQMDFDPPHYDEIIAQNDQIMMIEEQLEEMNEFVSNTFEEYKSSNKATADELEDDIARVEERLRDERTRLEELIGRASGDLDQVFQTKVDSVLDGVKEEIRRSAEVQDQKMAYLRQQQVKVQSDLKLSVKALRTEIGLTASDIPTRLSLYSLHRVQEMLLQYLMINSVYGGSITPEYPLSSQQLPAARPMNLGPQVDPAELDSIVGHSTVYTKEDQGVQTLKGTGTESRLQTANLNKNDSHANNSTFLKVEADTERSTTIHNGMPSKLRIHSNLSSLLKKDLADTCVPDLQPNQLDMFNSRNHQEVGSAGCATTVFSRRGQHVQTQPRLQDPVAGQNGQGVNVVAMQQLKKERFLMRGKIVLESAWLINQELLLEKRSDCEQQVMGIRQTRDIASNDLRELGQLMSKKNYDLVRTKIDKIDKQQIPNDFNGVLTVRAYKCYLDQIKYQYPSAEATLINQSVNQMLADEVNFPKKQLFDMPTSQAIESDFMHLNIEENGDELEQMWKSGSGPQDTLLGTVSRVNARVSVTAAGNRRRNVTNLSSLPLGQDGQQRSALEARSKQYDTQSRLQIQKMQRLQEAITLTQSHNLKQSVANSDLAGTQTELLSPELRQGMEAEAGAADLESMRGSMDLPIKQQTKKANGRGAASTSAYMRQRNAHSHVRIGSLGNAQSKSSQNLVKMSQPGVPTILVRSAQTPLHDSIQKEPRDINKLFNQSSFQFWPQTNQSADGRHGRSSTQMMDAKQLLKRQRQRATQGAPPKDHQLFSPKLTEQLDAHPMYGETNSRI